MVIFLTVTRRYAFRTGVALMGNGSEDVLIADGHRIELNGTSRMADVAKALRSAECTLPDIVRATGLEPDAAAGVLRRFDRLGLIRHLVADEREILLSLDPMSSRPFRRSGRALRHKSAVLSQFAFARRHKGRLVLESPLSHYRATLHTPAVAGLLLLLARGGDHDRMAGALGSCVAVLVHAGLAIPVGEAGAPDDPDFDERAFAAWSFHDLLFHSRSRPGMHDYPIGRTYPMRGEMEPPPAVPAQLGERLPLHSGGGMERPERGDLAAVLERRRSVRVHGSEPITVAALGEFLHRCARVRGTIPADPAAGIPYESSERPYPSGGGAYELEIYVVANRCAGLDPGVYHYAAQAHALERVAPPSSGTEAVLRDATRGCALRGDPHLLLVLTARLARLSWKYSGMAYSMTLKNVGVLVQTMYLVATAMNLAPCALGTGNTALLARVLNLPCAEETSVGEFLLGVE